LGSGFPETVGVSIAGDSKGGVGAAWVQYNQSKGAQLMYAYKDGNNDWYSQVITSSIYNPISGSLFMAQRAGLAFDANDLPVISFVAGGKIWVAYDPVTVPEPSVMLLLASGGMFVLLSRLKKTDVIKRLICEIANPIAVGVAV
jgi:hypothetical protein